MYMKNDRCKTQMQETGNIHLSQNGQLKIWKNTPTIEEENRSAQMLMKIKYQGLVQKKVGTVRHRGEAEGSKYISLSNGQQKGMPYPSNS